MTIGEIIREARQRAGLSQRALAARIIKEDGTPISLPYLNDIERDRRNPPGPALLKQFAAELDLSYEYLLFVAGDFPDDLAVLRRDTAAYSPERVEAAFQAFRDTLTERDAPGASARTPRS